MKLPFLTLLTGAFVCAHPSASSPREETARPVAKTTFSKKNLATGDWIQFGDDPDKAFYLWQKKIIEINSLENAADAMMFVHRFPKPEAENNDPKLGNPSVPESQRLVLDAEIKVIKENLLRGGLAAVHLNVEDHRTSAALMILEDGIFAYRHNKVHKMDTTDRWHHYRFVVEGDSQQIFVDDMATPVFEMKRPTRAGRHWASFGDSTAGGGAHAKFRKVRFTRYCKEPAPKEVD